MHIADTLLHLQQAGHPHFVEWSISFTCKAVSQNELRDLNEKMKTDLQNWLTKVSSLRTKLYSLNYFTCLQLLRISNEFYSLINNHNHEISNEIFLLLMALSPNLTVEEIKEVTSTTEAQSIAFRSFPTFSPPDHEESHYVMDESDVPEEVDKLNEAQKEIYFSVVQDYGFNEQLVLSAIHQYGSNEEDVLKYCFDPTDAQMFESKPVVSEDEDFAEPTVSEVDITNAIVQELINLDFEETLAIEAVKKCGEDLTKCFEYCSNQTLASSAIFSDETQEEFSDSILFDPDVSYKTESKKTSLIEYVCSLIVSI